MKSISVADLKSPILLSGLGYSQGQSNAPTTSGETEKVKRGIQSFFAGQSDDKSKLALCLPPGYQATKLHMDSPSNLIDIINRIVSGNICNLFSIPPSLVFGDSGAIERTAKEDKRNFIS